MNPDPTTDPAGYVLAVAKVREQRAKRSAGISPGPWRSDYESVYGPDFADGSLRGIAETVYDDDAEHIAAEANPEHALAEVALWRGIVEQHEEFFRRLHAAGSTQPKRPGVLLLRAVEAAKAYDQTKELD